MMEPFSFKVALKVVSTPPMSHAGSLIAGICIFKNLLHVRDYAKFPSSFNVHRQHDASKNDFHDEYTWKFTLNLS